MNTCWKCQRQVPDGQSECENGCGQTTPVDAADVLEQLRESMKHRRQLDWSKVKTTEDVIIVLSTIFQDVTLDERGRSAQFLARYLKPKNSGAEPTNPT